MKRRWRPVTLAELIDAGAMRAAGVTWREIDRRTDGRAPALRKCMRRKRRNPWAQYLVHRGAGL